jgi:hypothetical protein
MKKIILSAVCIAVSFTSIAQIGIGTTNPEGALDIVSSNSGIILPRVANTASITTPVNGMIIYDISSECVKAYQKNHWTGCLKVFGDAPPVANSVSINGNGASVIGETLTASYTYADVNADTEGTSTFQWYRADDATGINQTMISGATSSTYTLTVADQTKYIAFEVTPVASTGVNPTGIPVISVYQGPITSLKDETTIIHDVVVPFTGSTWMDRNLGAAKASEHPLFTDPETLGDLYQWGRGKDGHENRENTAVSTTQVTGSIANNGGLFIIYNLPRGSTSLSWTSFLDNNLWEDGINDPCPTGYRVPTRLDWATIRVNEEYEELHLPSNGFRDGRTGEVNAFTTSSHRAGYYWSSTKSSINPHIRSDYFRVFDGDDSLSQTTQSDGMGIRCIKE